MLAQNICQAFPNEEESTYFVPSRPNCPVRGKLFFAYNSKRNFLLRTGVIAKRETKLSKRRKTMDVYDSQLDLLSDQQPPSPEELEEMADFSEHSTADWDYLMIKWSESHDQRWKILKNEKLTPSEYMERYSILRSIRGIKLMEMDVNIRHPTSLTVDNWLTLYDKVLAKAKAKRRKCESLPKIITAIEESYDESKLSSLQ